jgi:hypothetical protein
MKWEGYFIVSRITANLGESNWIDLINLIRQIQTSGRRTEDQLQELGNLDRFEEVIDEDTSIWWSNQYMYEASYAEDAVSFDKFSQKLADAFGVDINDISYVEAMDGSGNVYATYIYGGKNRFRLALMGCPDDVNLCDRETSAQATRDHISANKPIWWGE